MSPLSYRESLDGIRAIAVVSVLLFHLCGSVLPGGFVGVDIFFVLSGYLITSIIYREIRSDSFSMVRFFQRRIARIFPAFLLVLLFVLSVASFTYTSQDFASQGALTTAASLSLTNMKLMLQGNYFTISHDAQPILHYWSLAIEEQFYIVFPIALVFLYRFSKSDKTVIGTILILTALSFASCVLLTRSNPTWAFYLLPTRAWELLIGSGLAIQFGLGRKEQDTTLQRIMGPCGLAMIVASLFIVRESNNFPGYAASLPVLGTVFIIGFNHSSEQWIEKLLSAKWMAFIGKISYSLYLWHWPVSCFVDYSLFDHSGLLRLLLKLAIIVATSLSCFYLIEGPARRFLSRRENVRVCYGLFFASMISLAIAGSLIRQSYFVNCSPGSVASGGIAINELIGDETIVLMGDSNGSMYGTAMKRISNETGCRANVISVAAGDAFPGSKLYDDGIAFVKNRKPKYVIFACSWTGKSNKLEHIQKAVEEISIHTDLVILIEKPATLPTIGTRKGIRAHGFNPVFENPTVASKRRTVNEFVRSLENDKVVSIGVDDLFERPDGSIRFLNNRQRQLFQDENHVSNYGAELVADRIISRINGVKK